jgi:hypothetical protein
MGNEKMELEAIATAFRRSAYNAYSNTLISGPKIITDAFNRMTNPQVGDWVIETSTVFMTRPRMRRSPSSDLDGVGILEEIAWENVQFPDPGFVWNEEEEGRPHPTEKIYYIRTLDGRRFRWSNASIIAAQTDI